MITARRIRWAAAALGAGALLAGTAASAAELRPVRAHELKLQGTWRAEDGEGAGTWVVRARVERPEILRGTAADGAWEAFSGSLLAAGLPGLAGEVPVTGWLTARNIAIRVEHPLWQTVVVSGAVDGSRISGEMSAPDGRRASWRGWWVAPAKAPVAAGEPRLSAVEE